MSYIFLYFFNSGADVGVIMSISPIGLWNYPIGGSLVYQNVNGLVKCPASFDLGICIILAFA